MSEYFLRCDLVFSGISACLLFYIEGDSSYETSANIHHSTHNHIPEDSTLQRYSCDNFKSNKEININFVVYSKTEKNEMGGACSTNGGEEECL
jgi:hypothetical protein